MPYRYIGIQAQHLGVGLAALCVRWGTYLATLMDGASELHPDLPGLSKEQPPGYSFITDAEMKRMNIEVCYNIFRVAQLYRDRGHSGFYELLSKAYTYLPMPQRAVRQNREAGLVLLAFLKHGAGILADAASSESEGKAGTTSGSPRAITRIPPGQADRYLANIVALQAWRNTCVEDIHAGGMTVHPLKPHQQRFTAPSRRRLLRDVAANLGAVLFWFDALFAERHEFDELPRWPETASALVNTLYGVSALHWSLADSSATITLMKR